MDELKLLVQFGRDNVPAVLCIYLVWWGTRDLSATLREIRDAMLVMKGEIDKCPKRP